MSEEKEIPLADRPPPPPEQIKGPPGDLPADEVV